ncbi:hypothetical protein BC941DRAFT_430780 [Chlamydoabsidia padenii]|nr:hypothetical protein BC941DRAFT_430780 [Chlamydoabsidia padenii]
MNDHLPIALPTVTYATTFAIPSLIMLFIVTRSNLTDGQKQLVAIPFLMANIMYPLIFNSDRSLMITSGLINFTTQLRFIDLLYTGPWLARKPVYIAPNEFWSEAGSFIRAVPKKEGKIYVKDRKFYHILPLLLLNLACSDILGSWMATFTWSDWQNLRQDRPGFHIICILLLLVFMTVTFNSAGYAIHFLFCIFIEGGSYSSEQYRPLINNPILSSSITDFWSNRWHQLMKSTWISFPFRPTRLIVDRALAKYTIFHAQIAYALAYMSVFLFSGLTHEFIVLSFTGWSVYYERYAGEHCVFFLLHALAMLLDPFLDRYPIVQRMWAFVFFYVTLHLYFNSFFNAGVMDGTLSPPYTNQFIYDFVKTHPAIQPYFGTIP